MANNLLNRSPNFRRIEKLEQILDELNSHLESVNGDILRNSASDKTAYPLLFLVGAARSGSTLFLQWLAATNLCAYPSNLLSRFYRAAIVGAKIQRLLTDPKYAFRDELYDLMTPVSFESENGKTRGALSPNEFYYFWRKFGMEENYAYRPNDQFRAQFDIAAFASELRALSREFGKPFALKALIASQNIDVLAGGIERSVFLWVRRDPAFTIQSILEARRRQFGSLEAWYSYPMREYESLTKLAPHRAVAGQVYLINRAVEESLTLLPDHRKMIIDYEDFCRSPKSVFLSLVKLLSDNGWVHKPAYVGPKSFPLRNDWTIADYSREEIERAYVSQSEKHSPSQGTSG